EPRVTGAAAGTAVHNSSPSTMRKRLDKIRFRGQRRDEFLDVADSPCNSDVESSEDLVLKPQILSREPDEAEASLQDDAKTDLNEIKGHLEIALLEKHFLREFKNCCLEKRSVLHLGHLKPPLVLHLQTAVQVGFTILFNLFDLKRKSSESSLLPPRPTFFCPTDKQIVNLSTSILKFLHDRFGITIEDFRIQPEETTVEPEEPLSARRYGYNAVAFLERGFRPLTNFKRSLSALSCWSSIYTSAFAFIYMHAVWRGWTIPMLLFLAILRLTLNYLISRGWRITWSIIPEVSEPVEPPKEDLTVSEKFQLVLDVAQKAQNLFGKMANILEKFKNLFMWVQPELTRKLYVGLWVAFVSSCLLPYPLLGFLIGVYAGIKFFLIDFLLRSCPKLRQRFDTVYIIWTNLPTDLQVKERSSFPGSKRSPVTGGVPQGVGRDEEGGRLHNSKKQPFHEVFNLPESERPLAEKIPVDSVYFAVMNSISFTAVHLCFESSSSRSGSSKRNKVIKLQDITDIQKYKVLSVLPGSGMGISVATPSTLKPMVFGAMIHRDEAFGAIFSQYMKIVCQDASINTDT
uniref:GRAM domain-containing protein n=1 Tax=Oryzias latipes TaxID=8090 RepID=A0A3P9IMH5_ORYLA